METNKHKTLKQGVGSLSEIVTVMTCCQNYQKEKRKYPNK